MRPLRTLLGRPSEANRTSNSAESSGAVAQSWNTLSTLQRGTVAHVDGRGSVYPEGRPVSVEIWFGHGERWVRGGSGDGLRQTRLGGLPILETRQKLDDGDVVQTAWADEAGDGQGRVVLQLTNETNVSVVVAVVVRPMTLTGTGRIEAARVAGSRIVVDKLPLVELDRVPGDVVTTVDDDDESSALLAQLTLGKAEIDGESDVTDSAGRCSLAALLPLTRGNSRQIEIVEGGEEVTVAAAPLDTVEAGWKAHLRQTPDIDLPGWPQHLPAALTSSLIGSTATTGRPLGDTAWRPLDDSLRAVALARAGVDWAAAHVADAMLADVTEGRTGRDDWAAVAAVCGAIAFSPEGQEVLARNSDAVAAVCGHGLSRSRTPNLVSPLLAAIEAAHGAEASADAARIEGTMRNPADGVVYAQHGFGVASESEDAVRKALTAAGPPNAERIGLAMAASAAIDHPYEPLVPIRSLAGSTWSWPRALCGDSPHSRAALLIGLTSLCIAELPDGVIDVFPGASSRWLGQKLSFTNMATSAGRLSTAVRWHGERPALLWELSEGPTDRPFTLTCGRLDPGFATSERAGEALLEIPATLVAERDAQASGGSRSLL